MRRFPPQHSHWNYLAGAYVHALTTRELFFALCYSRPKKNVQGPIWCAAHEAQKSSVLRNAGFKGVRAFRSELEFGDVGYCGGRKTGEPGEKPLEQDENLQQQTQPSYDVNAGNRTQATLVGGECSHYCAIPAPCFRLVCESSRDENHWYTGWCVQ